MGDFILNFLFLILSLILAAVGAAVGAWLQHRSWIHQQWEKLRANRTQAALETVKYASELIDRRLSRQRQFLWALQQGDLSTLHDAQREYRVAVCKWMENLGRIKTELWAAFGELTVISFESDIHDSFAQNGRSLEREFRNKGSVNLYEHDRFLDRFGRLSYEHMRDLLNRIQREEINGLTGRYKLSYQNWNNLSSAFLWKRLFGLSSQR
jgi:hypothetical protein